MSEHATYEAAHEAATAIRARTRHTPTVGLILGSGLGPLAARVADADIIPYAEVPNYPHSTVAGHAGRLVIGSLGGVCVCVMQGRVHQYEGYTPAKVTMPIRAMRLLGVQTLLLTNAAGGIRAGLRVGDLMALTDHINLPGLVGNHPLRGPNEERFGPRFPAMSSAYDPGLLELAHAEARAQGLSLHEGVYVMVSGPSFETPAEIRFLRAIGADAVGMSTASEVVIARHAGMRVLAISLISNIALDTPPAQASVEATHNEVLEAGQLAGPRLGALLEGVLRRLA
jgi:purine-nucleoside phosphorylase